MNDNARRIAHVGDDEAFIERLKNAMPKLPKLAAEKLQAGTPPVCKLHVFAELGIYAGGGKLREAHTSPASSAGSAGGVVCEGGKVGHE